MITLNLIDESRSGIPFQRRIMADGEPGLSLDLTRLGLGEKECRIYTRIASSDDLLLLLFAKNVLDYAGFMHVELSISYLLTARMDRQMSAGEPFSLKIIAGFINSAGFKCVNIFDAHSDVTAAVLDRCIPLTNSRFVQDIFQLYLQHHPTHDTSGFCLVSPDAGALKKIYKVAESLGNISVVECIKTRDTQTGEVSGSKVFASDLSDKTCFIVDDICDSGGTIAGVAAELKKLGASKIILIISHGIFSKGVPIAGVDLIYCTNSYKQWDSLPGQLAILDVMHYLD